MSDNKVIYIAGPMTGYPDFNYPLFHEVAMWLREWKGYRVINPAENFRGDQTREPWEYADAATQQVIFGVDEVVMLPGWESSPGARAEFALARWLKKPVWEAVRGSRWSCGWTLRECESWLEVNNLALMALERECVAEDLIGEGLADPDWEGNMALKYGYMTREQVLAQAGISNPVPVPTSILDDALAAVRGSRRENYGHPYDNHALIGKFWGLILGTDPVPADRVAMCMIGLKLARECNVNLRDNAVDIAGYADCLGVIVEKMKEMAA